MSDIVIPARARHDDADTSRAAAASIDTSAVEQKVLDALGVKNMTTEEIASHTEIRLGTITPRMAPLEKRGKIERTEERRKGESGRGRIVWRLKATPQAGALDAEPEAHASLAGSQISTPAPSDRASI